MQTRDFNDQKALNEASKFYYLGQILPVGSSKNLRDVHHRDFTTEQTEKMDLRGMTHFRNHNSKLPIGKIYSSFTRNGEKFVIGYIDMKDLVGNFTVREEILKGKNMGLSLQHKYDIEIFPGYGYLESKTPLEISSVYKPNSNRPNCRIIFGCLDSVLDRNKKRYIYFFSRFLYLTRNLQV
jgi:hypothetical protein